MGNVCFLNFSEDAGKTSGESINRPNYQRNETAASTDREHNMSRHDEMLIFQKLFSLQQPPHFMIVADNRSETSPTSAIKLMAFASVGHSCLVKITFTSKSETFSDVRRKHTCHT